MLHFIQVMFYVENSSLFKKSNMCIYMNTYICVYACMSVLRQHRSMCLCSRAQSPWTLEPSKTFAFASALSARNRDAKGRSPLQPQQERVPCDGGARQPINSFFTRAARGRRENNGPEPPRPPKREALMTHTSVQRDSTLNIHHQLLGVVAF